MTLGKYKNPLKPKKSYSVFYRTATGGTHTVEESSLSEQRKFGRQLFKEGVFIKLVNTNGILLPL